MFDPRKTYTYRHAYRNAGPHARLLIRLWLCQLVLLTSILTVLIVQTVN